MNVFILGTGRCGTMTLIKACEKLEEFTAGHETRSRICDETRLDYPKNHIEADNRLSWMLGSLDKKFGDSALYVHLKRDAEATAKSFNKRWEWRHSAIRMFLEGIHMVPNEKLDETQRLVACRQYVQVINDNVTAFMADKSQTLVIDLENLEDGFQKMCKLLGIKKIPSAAFAELKITHNESKH